MKTLGLIGYPLGHSFSPAFFAQKFEEEGITDWTYQAFPLANISDFPHLWTEYPSLVGLNVTIPHKQAVIPYLDQLSPAAAAIGAVNTIQKIDNQLIGHNTDVIGFAKGLDVLLGDNTTPISALILGTGGAARAVAYVLEQRGINYQKVSRKAKPDILSYADLDAAVLAEHFLIINTTPLGMYPAVDNCPNIPYYALSSQHYLYDLVYNPKKTLFLNKGIQQQAATINGWLMLKEQANAAWEIWTTERAI